ncbi:MAG: hypothetical protein L6R28_05725 [Planctomycetes bacterium]|nr:hypothetical protein [Planctomycetota bacterium]
MSRQPQALLPPPLIALAAPDAANRTLAGGKAAALAALRSAGFPVPEGAVLPDGVALDGDARLALQSAFPMLCPEGGALAVRSSVRAEDGRDASFAGQFLTVLGVRDSRSLVDAVARCRDSYTSERAAAYARRQAPGALDADAAPLETGPVLVQRQVAARWAGVCFTADPESGIEQLTVVEAVAGMGEALVSGQREPAYVRIDARSGHVVEARGLPADGGFLDLAQEVAALAESVRGHFAKAGESAAAQDIEWAHDGERLWLLQARPVTTPTFPLPPRRPLCDPEVWFHGNFAETMPGPVPTLSWDALLDAHGAQRWPEPFRSLGRTTGAFPVECIAGRVCWNVSMFAYLNLLNRFSLKQFRLIDARMAAAIEQLRAEGRIVPVRLPPGHLRACLALRMLAIEAYMLVLGLRALWQGEAAIQAFGTAAQRLIALSGTMPARELAPDEAWRRAQGILTGFLPAIVPLMGCFRLLFLPLGWASLAARWAGRPFVETVALTAGNPSGTVRMERALRAMGVRLRAAGVQAPCAPHALPAAEREALRAFLAEFGHRGPAEQDLSRPRLHEAPELALELALAATSSPAAEEARANGGNAETGKDRAAALLETIAARGVLGRARAALLRWLLPHARRMAPVREDAKHLFWMPVWDRVRALTLRAADGLVARGALEHRDDVFMLKVAELNECCGKDPPENAAVRRLARARRRQFEQWKRLNFPDVLRSDGHPVRLDGERAEGSAAWQGVPISSGVAEGPARVAANFEEARKLAQGEVLVARSVDPGWTPLFARAGGLVMEVGGVLSHGAVVAREMGLPAVASCTGATRNLRTGQRIRVDGNLGTVLLLDADESAVAQQSDTP